MGINNGGIDMSKFLKPFGPIIGVFQLPQELINELNELMDKGDLEDYSDQLAGKVEEAGKIPPEILGGYKDFLKECLIDYIQSCLQIPPEELLVHAGWVNRMVAGDYNPLHIHLNCSLSCIGLLQLPDGWKQRKDKKDGIIEFCHGTSHEYAVNIVGLDPPVGAFYLFPFYLQHTVNPFRIPGERRTFSVNFSVRMPQTKGPKHPEIFDVSELSEGP